MTRLNVSHHAALRWLDRVEGIGVEHVRVRDDFRPSDDIGVLNHVCRMYGTTPEAVQRRIADLIPDNVEDGLHDVGGAHLLIRDGLVTTVVARLGALKGVDRRREEKRRQRVKNRAIKFDGKKKQGWHDE
jgi:hypothetical protein